MGMPGFFEKQLEKLFGYFPQSFCILNTGGDFIRANAAFCEAVCFLENDLINKAFIHFIHPEDQQTTLQALKELQDGAPAALLENRFKTKDQKYKWISWNICMPHNKDVIYCSGQNITEQKETEEKLLKTIQRNTALINALKTDIKNETAAVPTESNHWIENIIQHYTDSFLTVNNAWTILAFNQKALDLVGLPDTLIKQANFWSVFPPENNHQLTQAFLNASTHSETVKFEEFYPHLDKWLEVTAFPHSDTVTLFFKDISIRKKQEVELLHLAQDYELLFANNPLPMWAYDLNELQILMVNNAALNLYGYTRDEFLKLNLFDLRPEAEHERLRNEMKTRDIFKELQLTEEWQHQRKDGSIVYVDLASHRIQLNDRSARLIVVNNITARREAQNKLLNQNTRLREIAQLSSHDLRGPVASILGLVSLFDHENLDINLNNQIIENLKISAEQLDSVIHAIVKKTYDEGR